VNNGIPAGVFASNLNNAPSNANWNYGASHSYGDGFRAVREKEYPNKHLAFSAGETRKIGRQSARAEEGACK
jgi:hypothetical protein